MRAKNRWVKHKDPLEKKLPTRDRAWRAFSTYVRTRDCLEATGTTTSGVCVTCGRAYPYKDLQAGHFVSGRHDSVLFSEKGCHTQCKKCNLYRSGEWTAYYFWMIHRYGASVFEEMLKEWLDRSVSYSPEQYLQIERKYEGRLALLKMGMKR
jgi:hypothetical protein